MKKVIQSRLVAAFFFMVPTMSRIISYTYRDEQKTLPFSYRDFHSIHEAVAAYEGIDIRAYLKMEQSIEAVSDTKTVRNYRDAHFKKLGFGIITLLPKENLAIGEKNRQKTSRHY